MYLIVICEIEFWTNQSNLQVIVQPTANHIQKLLNQRPLMCRYFHTDTIVGSNEVQLQQILQRLQLQQASAYAAHQQAQLTLL